MLSCLEFYAFLDITHGQLNHSNYFKMHSPAKIKKLLMVMCGHCCLGGKNAFFEHYYKQSKPKTLLTSKLNRLWEANPGLIWSLFVCLVNTMCHEYELQKPQKDVIFNFHLYNMLKYSYLNVCINMCNLEFEKAFFFTFLCTSVTIIKSTVLDYRLFDLTQRCKVRFVVTCTQVLTGFT